MRSDDQASQEARGQEYASAAASPALAAIPGAEPAAAPVEEPRFLFFRCAGADCAVPLVALREVLPQCPAALPLPHSPEWLLGVFALRAELVGLADPAPLLFGTAIDPMAVDAPHQAALLAATGAHVLAWAVESIGASVPLTASAIQVEEDGALMDSALMNGAPASGRATDAARVPDLAVAAPYAAGAIELADGRRYTVIHAEALLADMLRALEERPAMP